MGFSPQEIDGIVSEWDSLGVSQAELAQMLAGQGKDPNPAQQQPPGPTSSPAGGMAA
jgi:hypothetical protein